ncbi:MAG: DUF2800 domain-containing protein [Clostridiales bacterium]|nr:DUF2800 domain-containing protein [Clostridiales bacterium]
MSRDHALLSASGAYRWISCPPSAKLQEQYTDKGSEYAAQGTDAHSLGEWKILSQLGKDLPDPRPTLQYFDREMDDHTDGYAAYVLEALAEARKTCGDPLILVEQRVDFSTWVPDGFGTADAIICGNRCLDIIDLKYGTGVEVSAENNPQMSCYALGAVELLDDLYGIDTVTMTIYQPRRENISRWTVSKEELLAWAENTLRPAAQLAAAGEGEFHSGEHCRFCRARHECRARADEQMRLLKYDFQLPPTLTDEDVEDILGRVDSLISWAEDIKAYALEAAVGGKCWHGYKLVEGRSNRKYTDEKAVAAAVTAAGKDPYEHKLLGITAMTSLLGKKQFNDILGGLIEKPQGKPTLVPESDKRPALSHTDFDLKGE